MNKVKEYPRLIHAKPLSNYKILLRFDSGEEKVYDFASNFTHPFYKPLANADLFCKLAVKNGTVHWASGQDFPPFRLYDESVVCHDFDDTRRDYA